MYNNLGGETCMTYPQSSAWQKPLWHKSLWQNPSWKAIQPPSEFPRFPRQPELSKPSTCDAAWSLWRLPLFTADGTAIHDENGWNNNSMSILSANAPSFSLFSQPSTPSSNPPRQRSPMRCLARSGSRSPQHGSPRNSPTAIRKIDSSAATQHMHRINVKPSPFQHGCICGHGFEHRTYDSTSISAGKPFVPKTPVVRIRLRS